MMLKGNSYHCIAVKAVSFLSKYIKIIQEKRLVSLHKRGKGVILLNFVE